MNRDPVIFDPGKGFVFGTHSVRRGFWRISLSLAFFLMAAATFIGNKVYDLGNLLLNLSYRMLRNCEPLRTLGDRGAYWIQNRAWRLGWVGDRGYQLFIAAYPRSGRQLLGQLNQGTRHEAQHPILRVDCDTWNDVLHMEIPEPEWTDEALDRLAHDVLPFGNAEPEERI